MTYLLSFQKNYNLNLLLFSNMIKLLKLIGYNKMSITLFYLLNNSSYILIIV